MSIHGVLGETTSYPTSYDASVLFAIARDVGRQQILANEQLTNINLSDGIDVWQAFELSWLNRQGISKVAMARIIIPASSPNIVESKSLKLYLNSLNFSRFDDVCAVQSVIERDLSACVGASVRVLICPLDGEEFAIAKPLGVCIDGVLDGGDELAIIDDVDASVLAGAVAGQMTNYQFHTNLLRSNCPVTNQPDWGTLSVVISTDKVVDYQQILRYVLTFRQHNGFHEQCVEQIFADLMANFSPISLMVQANYTRRGGIDINPVRVYRCDLPKICRQIRQ
ncbi:NADPH-dependent 7-cyano-7-deazaguanine reductase QueF [Moraxella sp. ZJ142]|uniref:NADPH-dependent 7-cyano-7-deazaguanine reductase QueF n=1 Tax=Moraxella marmotae TaxID=3344520 RepID=UPI0035D41650